MSEHTVYRCEICGGRGWYIDRFSYRDTRCFMCRGEGGYMFSVVNGKTKVTPAPYPDVYERAWWSLRTADGEQ